MAATAATAAQSVTICSTPWLVKRWELANSTEVDTIVFTHGEDRSPDIVLAMGQGTTDSEVGLNDRVTSDTTFTIDCEDDGNDDVIVYAIWFDFATGGLTNVS